jgi:hypothetical protein
VPSEHFVDVPTRKNQAHSGQEAAGKAIPYTQSQACVGLTHTALGGSGRLEKRPWMGQKAWNQHPAPKNPLPRVHSPSPPTKTTP